MNDHTYIFTPTKNYYTIHKEIFSTNLNAGTNIKCRFYIKISSVQSLSRVWLFDRQASLSITNSQSLPKLMSAESVMLSNHLILCHPLLLPPSIFPSIRLFSNESALCIRWTNIGVSASASVLPMNTQNWSPLGWTGWISLQSKGLSRVFSNITVQKHQFFGLQQSVFKSQVRERGSQELWSAHAQFCAWLMQT